MLLLKTKATLGAVSQKILNPDLGPK